MDETSTFVDSTITTTTEHEHNHDCCCDTHNHSNHHHHNVTHTNCDPTCCTSDECIDELIDKLKDFPVTNIGEHYQSQLNDRNISIKNEFYDETTEIYYRVYHSEEDLKPIMDLITKDLSEPYSIYTYRYFLNNWPDLCYLALDKEKRVVGCVVCKMEGSRSGFLRGYIAMLAVETGYRRKQIGSTLVRLVIQKMVHMNCSEVALEAEITNQPALKLYENLGFIRERHLFRYYLNGNDAYYLKLYLK